MAVTLVTGNPSISVVCKIGVLSNFRRQLYLADRRATIDFLPDSVYLAKPSLLAVRLGWRTVKS